MVEREEKKYFHMNVLSMDKLNVISFRIQSIDCLKTDSFLHMLLLFCFGYSD